MKTGKTVSWNTGCKYTAKGQRISTQVLEDGFLFTDIDRGIDGFIPFDKVKSQLEWYEYNLNDKDVKDIVNRAYLHDNYEMISNFQVHFPIIKELRILAEEE